MNISVIVNFYCIYLANKKKLAATDIFTFYEKFHSKLKAEQDLRMGSFHPVIWLFGSGLVLRPKLNFISRRINFGNEIIQLKKDKTKR